MDEEKNYVLRTEFNCVKFRVELLEQNKCTLFINNECRNWFSHQQLIRSTGETLENGLKYTRTHQFQDSAKQSHSKRLHEFNGFILVSMHEHIPRVKHAYRVDIVRFVVVVETGRTLTKLKPVNK